MSGNKSRKLHPQAYKRIRDKYTTLVRILASGVPRCKPDEVRHVRFTRYGSRELDYDNLVSGMKPLLDAIRIVGLIHDDRPDCVRLNYNQAKSTRKNARTVITICEVCESRDG